MIATAISVEVGQRRRMTGLEPLCLDPAQLEKVTVCTRPFRAAGPRIEAERIGNKLLVHNYGHGGSGWSLSWGSAELVVPLALEGEQRNVAVLGCGAMGLTSAIALQRAGAQVTMYARERPAQTRSAKATGTWTPDARFALQSQVDSSLAARWEQLARASFAAYADLLTLPGQPVELHDRYTLSDLVPEAAWAKKVADDPIGFARLEHRIADLYPDPIDLAPENHSFAAAFCRQTRGYRFNIAVYSRYLEQHFRERGGTFVQADFHSLSDLLLLPAPVIVNCTGFAAGALLGDTSLIPVRGQISWLPPQRLPYSIVWDDLNLVPRADGTVVQWGAQGDGTGWQDANEQPDAQETAAALARAAQLYRAQPNSRTSKVIS